MNTFDLIGTFVLDSFNRLTGKSKVDWYELAFGDQGFYWDKGIARYRDRETGKLVAERRILEAGRQFTEDVTKARIQDLTTKFQDGRLTLADWQTKVQREIKDSWVVQSAIGQGGIKNMDAKSWGRVGGRLSFEFRKLAGLANEIKLGKISIGQIRFRMDLYAQATRIGFHDAQTYVHKIAGYAEERRHLSPAENCVDCLFYESLNWQPIGSLPEPGVDSVCGRNCLCEKEYR